MSGSLSEQVTDARTRTSRAAGPDGIRQGSAVPQHDGGQRGDRPCALAERGDAGGSHPDWAESWPAAGQLAVCARPFWKAPKEPVPIANARNAPPAGAVFSNVFMNFIGDLLSNFGRGE